jgi:hypothetical protein
MSFKPFVAIDLVKQYYDRAAKGSRSAFVQLESLLKTLELPECDTMQIKNVVLNDSVEISDSGDLTIYGGEKQYALVCTGTPGATAISAQILDPADPGVEYLFFGIKFRIDAEITETKHLYRRHNAADDVLYIDILIDGTSKQLVCNLGGDQYFCDWPLGDMAYWKVGEIHDLLIKLDYAEMDLYFMLDQYPGGPATFSNQINTPTTNETISVGCAGVSLLSLAVFTNPIANSMATPSSRPVGALNFYNFKPGETSTEIPDLTLNATWETPITLNEENATIEAVEVV